MKYSGLASLVFLFGFLVGLVMENYKFHHQEKYFINTCVDNNLKYSEADRNERCQQAYKLFTDKE